MDPKKVGISGLAWHCDGDEILFCDRLGRLSVITGLCDAFSCNFEFNEGKKIKNKGCKIMILLMCMTLLIIIKNFKINFNFRNNC